MVSVSVGCSYTVTTNDAACQQVKGKFVAIDGHLRSCIELLENAPSSVSVELQPLCQPKITLSAIRRLKSIATIFLYPNCSLPYGSSNPPPESLQPPSPRFSESGKRCKASSQT